MPIQRLDANPLISPDDVPPTREDVEVYCTINPGAVWVNGEALLLVRVGERPIEQPGMIAALVYDHDDCSSSVQRYKLDDPDIETLDGRTFHYRGKRLLTSLSHLRLARSKDGVNFDIDPSPAMFPETWSETFGLEDPRITQIGAVREMSLNSI